MKTLALVLPQAFEYSRMIRSGVVERLEEVGGWQVLQLPYFPSGKWPVCRGMESLGGVVTWADGKQLWIPELAAAGVPVVNCGADWQGTVGVGNVGSSLQPLFELALGHFEELGLRRIYYFGYKLSTDPQRSAALGILRKSAEARGIRVESLEVLGKNPDENLDRLLAPEHEWQLIEAFGKLEGFVGILAENDYFARLACNVAILAGKRVPADLAILGCFGELLARHGEPTISSVPLPGEEIGARAFDMILKAHSGKAIHGRGVKVDAVKVVVRESTGGKRLDVRMERVHRTIERDALKGLTVQELPDVAGISLKALRRRYWEVYGVEPSEHIRRIRLAKARECLGATNDSMSAIASACGFASQAAFYNYFQRHEGLAPSEYRGQHRK